MHARPRDPCPDPAAELEQKWEQALLEAALEELRRTLSETNWRLLQMRIHQGRTVREVADALGLEPEQIWARQHRITAKLGATLNLYSGRAFPAARTTFAS